MDAPTDQAFERFIQRWQDADGTERANYQLFLTELTELLGLERPAWQNPEGALYSANG